MQNGNCKSGEQSLAMRYLDNHRKLESKLACVEIQRMYPRGSVCPYRYDTWWTASQHNLCANAAKRHVKGGSEDNYRCQYLTTAWWTADKSQQILRCLRCTIWLHHINSTIRFFVLSRSGSAQYWSLDTFFRPSPFDIMVKLVIITSLAFVHLALLSVGAPVPWAP